MVGKVEVDIHEYYKDNNDNKVFICDYVSDGRKFPYIGFIVGNPQRDIPVGYNKCGETYDEQHNQRLVAEWVDKPDEINISDGWIGIIDVEDMMQVSRIYNNKTAAIKYCNNQHGRVVAIVTAKDYYTNLVTGKRNIIPGEGL